MKRIIQYLIITSLLITIFVIPMMHAALPEISINQGTTSIPNGGSYNFGDILIGSNSIVTFTIQNTGTVDLNLTGAPRVQISGSDLQFFNVDVQPASPVASGGSATFEVRFSPTGFGSKTATISITSDDTANSPYTFTITGTGIAAGTPLTFGAWNTGNLSNPGEEKIYYFTTTPGTTYALTWDDSSEGSGSYTGDVKVTAYRLNLRDAYWSEVYSDLGYYYPLIFSVSENFVYIKVRGHFYSSTGTFALKPSLNRPEMIVKQGSTIIPTGTGTYNFGNVAPYSNRSTDFRIENTGTTTLNFTGSPQVRISGPNASQFTVTSQPGSPVPPNRSAAFFTLRFSPTDPGVKTATVSISNNDPAKNPYTFTVTGTGTEIIENLPLGYYVSKYLSTGQTKTYWFTATPGQAYQILWDDGYEGSGYYSCDILVSGYRQDLTTTYFSNIDSAYYTPQTITAQDNIVYLKVAGNYGDYGTFGLMVVENE